MGSICSSGFWSCISSVTENQEKENLYYYEKLNMIIACILLYRNFPLPLLIIVIIIVSIKWSWDKMMSERKWKALGISNHDNSSDKS